MSDHPHRTVKTPQNRVFRRFTALTAPLLCAVLAVGFAAPVVAQPGDVAAQITAAPAEISAELTGHLRDSVAQAPSFRSALDALIGGESSGDDAVDPPDVTPDQGDNSRTDPAPPEDWVDSETGRVELLVYFADPGLSAPVQGDPELAATALQAEAESHWERIDRDLAKLTSDGRVEVLNHFWVTSAVLVSAEANERTLADLAALPGAIDVTPNFTVEPLDDTLEIVEGETGSTTTDPAEAEAADAVADAADAAALALADAETPVTYGLDKIGADDAWRDFGARGQGVRVAVLDTGVDATHPDIGSRLVGRGSGDPSYPGGWINFDRTGKPLVTKPTDPGSHGTHVAGTILGGSASGTSIGVAPEAELMAANVLSGGGSTAKILAALEWVISPTDGTGAPAGRAADVINMSLGSGGFEHQLARAIRNVRDAGIFPAVAIGNKSGTTSAPGNYFDAVAVGMTNADDQVDAGSSGGILSWGSAINSEFGWPESYVKPDISAPGVQVYSAMPGNRYGDATGTSMATPHVAGAVALIRSAQGGLSVDEVSDALKRTAWHPLPGSGPDIAYGHGRIDVHAAISSVLGESGVKAQVTNASTGAPLAGALVSYADRGETWTTDAQGRFTARLSPGTYTLTIQRFGYETTQTAPLVVGASGFSEIAVPLTPITVGSLTGSVLDHGTSAPISGASVSILGQELTTTTDAQGTFRFDALPVGSYQVRVAAEGKAEAMSAPAPVKAALTTTVKFRLADLSRVLVLGDSGGSTAALLAENGFVAQSRPDLPANLGELRDFDAVLWDTPTGDTSDDRIQRAIAETDAAGTGILWLDLGASEGSGIATLSRMLGDPAERAVANDRAASAVGYRVTAGHEILAGGILTPDAIQPGGIIVQNSAPTGPKNAAWFERLTGTESTVIAETVVQYSDSSTQPVTTTTQALGTGIAVDQRANNRHAYLALHGTSAAIDSRNWSTPSVQVLLNTVRWAAPAALQAPEPEIGIPTKPVVEPPVIKPPIVTPPKVDPPTVDPPREKPTKPNDGRSQPPATVPTAVPSEATPMSAPTGPAAQPGAASRAPGSQSKPKPLAAPEPPVASARELTKRNAGGVTARVADGIAHITVPGAAAGDWYFLHVYPSMTAVDWIRANAEKELRIDVSKLVKGKYKFAFTAEDGAFTGWVDIVIPGAAESSAPAGLVDEPTQLGVIAPEATPAGGFQLSSGEQLMLLGSALLILAAAGLVLFGPRKPSVPSGGTAVSGLSPAATV